MSTPPDDAVLLDLEAAARDAIAFLGGLDEQAFLADRKTQAAVRHQILIMGEVVKRLSRSFRGRNSGVPWQEIAGMRDKLIHNFDSVNLHEVWRTGTMDVPNLVAFLERARGSHTF